MEILSQDVENKISEFLKTVGCCSVCSVRLSGSKNPEKLIQKTASTPDEEIKICIACLGILQYQKDTLKRIKETVETSGYDSSTFICYLSIPRSIRLRDFSLHLHISDEFKLSSFQLDYLKKKTLNVKEVWKNAFIFDIQVDIHKKLVVNPEPSPFSIQISFSHADDDIDCLKLFETYKVDESNKRKRKRNANKYSSKNHIERILNQASDKDFRECFSVPPNTPSTFISLDKITLVHSNLFIGARYNKFSRQLCQTPWFIDGEKKMETSLQDQLSHILIDYTKADSIKFLSSGREDVDVRCIHSGRPFAIELINPKITNFSDEILTDITLKTNASTKLVKIIDSFKVLSQNDLKTLKLGEVSKTKFYRALCWIKNNNNNKEEPPVDLDRINNLINLKIIQKTPIRVLHRRPLILRKRMIFKMRARWLTLDEKSKIKSTYENIKIIPDDLFVFDFKTQAGTYVKEFVHSDFGRTKPNLCDILEKDIDIIALDVTGINIHWP